MTHTDPANANEPSDVEVLATQAGRYVMRGINAHNAKAAQALSVPQDPVVPAPTEPAQTKRRGRNLVPVIVKLARQPSAWRGLVMFLAGCGIAIDPSLAAHISAVGMALAGLIGMLTDDHPAAE